jgi:serine/threonine protein kinase
MSVRAEEISQDDPEQLFRVLDVIGQGSFGIVCTCVNTSDNHIYAVKFIEINDDDSGGDLQNEIDILKAAGNCEYVVRYYGAYLKENYLMIVMEYCDGGSVLDLMQVCDRPLTEQQISAVCCHVLQGLHHMHSNKILHRDIKAGNVLLMGDGMAKLADFGVSTKLMTTIQKHKTVVGSPYWMSPEVIVAPNGAAGYDHKADIWSLGITAIEMAETKPPHYEINPLRVIFVIPNRPPPTLKQPAEFSDVFRDFLGMCLRKNPTERPSAMELLSHPFITQTQGKAIDIIKQLVAETKPIITEARRKAKEAEEEEGDSIDTGTVKAGTILRVNTMSKTATAVYEGDDSSADEDDEFHGDSYATIRYGSSSRQNTIDNAGGSTGSFVFKETM